MITRRVARATAIVAVAGVLWLTGLVGAAAQDEQPSGDDEAQLTIMSRNLYLGADVGMALDLLPDLSAAAELMWDQVAATDFDARVVELAAEAVRFQPDVIGIQEATVWSCRSGLFASSVPVFDFTTQFLDATQAAGVSYVVAEKDGVVADNPGYAIPPIPTQTTVNDPETFQPLFGSDSADCGFTIGDALLVRADLADRVLAVGNSEYEERYAVVPVVFTIERGYSWVDLAVGGTTARVVTTHLESLWDAGEPVPSAVQARQLVDDLADTTVPLVVMGDFNADPRDPRAPDAPNPAQQPVASDVCPAQPEGVTLESAQVTCNAYWTMRDAGFLDAGPDVDDPANYTWGSSGVLAGPDPDRLDDALRLGNEAGFTERLDHVFVANGATVTQTEVIGNDWPDGDDLWECSSTEQVATTEEASRVLAEAGVADPITGTGVCLPTDHAGIVAVVDVSAGPQGSVNDPAPPSHNSFTISLVGWLAIIAGGLVLVAILVLAGIVWFVLRRRKARQEQPASAAQ